MGFFQASIPPTPKGTDLTNQTIIVTGANTGLGFEACLQLLRLKATHIIMGVRTPSKGGDARARLLEDMQVIQDNPDARITVLKLDLISYDSVLEFAAQVKNLVTRLDVLLLNAGVNLAGYASSPAGFETLIQTNYLSNALLTLTLYPLLSSTLTTESHHTPTISIVGSMAQHFNNLAKIDPLPPSILKHLSSRSEYSTLSQYPNSKMLVALFVRELAKHAVDKNVLVNNLCPGTVDTAADDKLPFYLRIPMNLNRRLRARTVVEGARTLVFASEIVGEEGHGQYIACNEISPLASFADTVNGVAFGEQLWRETVDECEKVAATMFSFLKR